MRPRALALLLSLPLFAQDFTAVDQGARAELTKLNVPGAVIAIVRGNQVVYQKAFGVANLETGDPLRPEMLFRLGSTTKMLTATALVGLSLEGKLDLNAPIGRYISGLPPRLSQITANQLLSHTAGIRDEAPMYGLHDDSALGKGIRAWTDDWLFTTPGRIFSYSNPGYWMAGYLIETLAGKPYADAMEELVFRPCGMTHTTLRPTTAMTWPLSQGHQESEGRTTVARPAADNAASWPAGSVFSNTADLASFTSALLNQGQIDGKPALDPKIFSILATAHTAYPDSKDTYGYGLTIRTLNGVRIVEHGGSRQGYGSSIRMAPDQHVAIIVLANRTGASLPATVEVASALLLPMQARPVAYIRLALSGDDLRNHPGVYQNGSEKLEIVVDNDRLLLKQGTGDPMPLAKLGSGVRFTARTGEVVMVPGKDGKTEYVFSGSRAFARVQ